MKPNKKLWEYDKANETTRAELKRVMLVLRQEMISLEKNVIGGVNNDLRPKN